MSSAVAESATDADRIDAIRQAMPEDTGFPGAKWRLSPRPFSLAPNTVRQLQQLGPRLHRFQRAANQIYFRSRKGSLPGWIADYLDRGIPDELLEITGGPGIRENVPRVIRPDLLLTEKGFRLSGIGALPGGIGLTAWLGQTYARLGDADEIVGGGDGMIRGFSSIFDGARGADIVISGESGDEGAGFEWLGPELDGDWRVRDAESYAASDRDVFRFFELSESGNLSSAAGLAGAAEAGAIEVTAPFKPFLEEDLWAALFWMRPLREVWRRELRDSHWRQLREIMPHSWVMDPEPLPPHAAVPRLDINDFSELKHLGRNEREFVLRPGRFSKAGESGSGVAIGSESTGEAWSAAVGNALGNFEEDVCVLQEFRRGRLVEHPFWNGDSFEILKGRVRLRPYYFVDAANPKNVNLGGVQALIFPADQTAPRETGDAILVPCQVSEDGD